jgi:hypothetical protein
MSSINEILQNHEKRLNAVESESIDDHATLVQIQKLYADIGIEVKLRYWLHKYRKCGDTQPLYGAVCGTNTFL